MNERKDADHWKALASDLGAEAAEEKAQTEKPICASSETPPVVESPRRATKDARPSRAPRCGSDWNALASDLGLAPPEPAKVKPVDQAAARVSETDTTPLPALRDQLADDNDNDNNINVVAARSESFAEFTSFDAAEPDEMVLETVTEEFFEEVIQVRLEAEEEDAEADDTEVEGDQTESPTRSRRRGRRRRRPERGRSTEPATSETPEAEDKESDEEPEVEEVGGDAAEAEPRSRRRRRRRRSSRRDSASVAERGDGVELDGDVDSDDDDDEQPTRSHEDSDDSEMPTRKHRKIPTWDEAIEVIVNGNLESRSKSPGPKGSPRGSRRGGRRRN